jgi:hypothetical protein
MRYRREHAEKKVTPPSERQFLCPAIGGRNPHDVQPGPNFRIIVNPFT